MEPSGPGVTNDLQGLRLDLLRRAVDVYLALAYTGGPPPEVVRRRLEWSPELDAAALMSRPPFERVGKTAAAAPIYALRLGNSRYPHMKLQVQPWPNDAGFMLSVNTHDQVLALDPCAADAPAFRELQAENQRIKEAIEQAWDQADLPTFLSYLRKYIEERAGAASADGSATPESGSDCMRS